MNTDDTGSPTRQEQGSALRKARVALGLSQADLAGVLGVTPQFLSQVEKGRKALTREKQLAAARYLGVPPRHLHDPARFPVAELSRAVA